MAKPNFARRTTFGICSVARLAGLALVTVLSACVFPVTIVGRLDTKVVDAVTGDPIVGALVLRIVCDIHDFGCQNGKLEKGV